MLLLEPSTCKLNIKKLVVACIIEETDVQRMVILHLTNYILWDNSRKHIFTTQILAPRILVSFIN